MHLDYIFFPNSDFNYLVCNQLDVYSKLSLKNVNRHFYEFLQMSYFPKHVCFYFDKQIHIDSMPISLLSIFDDPIVLISNQSLICHLNDVSKFSLFYEIRIVTESFDSLKYLQHVCDRLVVIKHDIYNFDYAYDYIPEIKYKRLELHDNFFNESVLPWACESFQSVICYCYPYSHFCGSGTLEKFHNIKDTSDFAKNVSIRPILYNETCTELDKRFYEKYECVIYVCSPMISELISSNIKIYGAIIDTCLNHCSSEIDEMLQYLKNHSCLEYIDLQIKFSRRQNNQVFEIFNMIGSKIRNVYFHDMRSAIYFHKSIIPIHDLKLKYPSIKFKIETLYLSNQSDITDFMKFIQDVKHCHFDVRFVDHTFTNISASDQQKINDYLPENDFNPMLLGRSYF